MTRRTLYLPALIVAAVLMACAAALLAVSEKAEATFPGKNGRIAYWSNFVIYTINPNGSGKTKVTNTTVSGDVALDYSPTGKKITYTDYEGFDVRGTEIYTIKVGGGGKTQLTHNNREDSDPSYSPDGKRIAYTHWDGHDDEIWTSNTNGTGTFQVTNNGTMDLTPTYSPDGKKIVYYTGNDLHGKIYTINVGGGVSLKSRRAPIFPGGVVRSGFPSGRSQQPRSRRGPGFNSLGPSFCLYSPNVGEGEFSEVLMQDSA